MEAVKLLFKVLWAPGETMFHVSKKPRVLAPLILICLFSLGSAIVNFTKLDPAEMTIRVLERSGRAETLPEDVKDRIMAQSRGTTARVLGFASALVWPIMVVVVVTGIYFLVFTILGREGSFKAFLAATAFAFIPTIFRQLAMILSVFALPPSDIFLDELGSISPAVFLDRDAVSRVVFVGASLLDVVSIWILILLVIGYGFLVRKSVSKTMRAAGVFGVYLIYTGLRLGMAALFGF